MGIRTFTVCDLMLEKTVSAESKGRQLVSNARKELDLGWFQLDSYSEEKTTQIIRNHASKPVGISEGAAREDERILLFAVRLLHSKREYEPDSKELSNAIAAYVYDFAIRNKHFVSAANIAAWYLDREKLQSALETGREWYVSEGHLRSLRYFSENFGLNVGDAEMRNAVRNAYERYMNDGYPDKAASIVEGNWTGEQSETSKMIRTAVSMAIGVCEENGSLYDALKMAKKYRKYGFEDEEARLSKQIDKETGVSKERMKALQDAQRKRFYEAYSGSNMTPEEEKEVTKIIKDAIENERKWKKERLAENRKSKNRWRFYANKT